MARPCTACRHAQRDQIDRAIMAGDENTQIAKRFGLERDAIRRHKKDHVVELAVLSVDAAKCARADTIVGDAMHLEDEATAVLAKAKRDSDGKMALAAIATLKALLEFRAKLGGALAPHQTNILNVNLTEAQLDEQLTVLAERHRAIPVQLRREEKALPEVSGA